MIIEEESHVKVLGYQDDLKIPNAGTFKLENEDHTLGNLIREQLLAETPGVLFAGYKKPHPLEKHVLIKVQTVESKHPIDAFRHGVNALLEKNLSLRRQFQERMKRDFVNRG